MAQQEELRRLDQLRDERLLKEKQQREAVEVKMMMINTHCYHTQYKFQTFATQQAQLVELKRQQQQLQEQHRRHAEQEQLEQTVHAAHLHAERARVTRSSSTAPSHHYGGIPGEMNASDATQRTL